MEYNSPEFRKWLDKLQQEIWQLELIISGFAIYGLFSAFEAIEAIEVNAYKAFFSDQVVQGYMWLTTKIFWYILTFNLMLHVLFRGL